MKRAIVVVIDALGIGALPDAAAYGDSADCNTLGNVARANGGLTLPHLGSLGLGNIIPVEGVPPTENPRASFGRMMEVSEGKDTTTGHWELAGFVLDTPFRVYPEGFPTELMERFVAATECGGYFANCPASGTEVIQRHHAEHTETGHPIIYTSADSVFQIACNTAVVPLDRLYDWCETARGMLTDEYNVSRVIARPYHETSDGLERLSADRRDYAVEPWKPTVMNRIVEHGGRVLGIGKIVDIFVGSGVTHAVHTGSNREGLDLTIAALGNELDMAPLAEKSAPADARCEFIFTNLVDTDALYGHRRDPAGYAAALEEIDRAIPAMLERVGPEDLLIITADHGCDPTAAGTDHTREYVPLLVYNPQMSPSALGTLESFTYVAATVADWLEVSGVAVPSAISEPST